MNQKIKVIELIQEIAEGGAETLVKDYMLNLNPKVFDVSLVTEFPLSVRSANVRILMQKKRKIYAPYGISRERIIDKIIRKIRKIFVPLRLQDKYRFSFVQKTILKLRPDVIHVHLRMLKYLVPIASKIEGVKLFYTCHSLPCRYFNDNDCKEELDAAKYLLEHNNLQFIALHDEMRQELNHMFGIDNTIVINNCVDLRRFREVEESKIEIRQSLGIPTNAFVVGHIGRFIWCKNQPFIVDIFNEVLKRHPNAFLLLVGTGDASDTIVKLHQYGIEERCLILSHRTDTPLLLNAMDVFVLPSILEGLSIAAIEAQASGLRCVMSSTIPKEVFFSENAIEADLSECASIWAEKLCKEEIKGRLKNDIEKYDVAFVMKEVQRIYSSL